MVETVRTMARYQIKLTYDGTGFVGSQRQLKSRTVQSELEKALGKLNWEGKSVLIAGRTDTGVHASGQVGSQSLGGELHHEIGDIVAVVISHGRELGLR